MDQNYRIDLRNRVAREAAAILYSGQEKEYRQAKLRASKTLSINILPRNAEIATELDLIAEEKEGKTKQERLSQMRQIAFQIMQALKNFHPLLVGSVWRGTAHRNSDIDIIVYSENPQKIVLRLQENNYAIVRTQVQTVTRNGEKKQSFHIYVNIQSNQAEIVIRSPDDIDQQVVCEIYGDNVTGLTINHLQKILRESPYEKFVPI
ncbi:MAG: DUF4269 domain-containing protein [Candidatus Bathyarchaeota archaeon]|nr:MAG: DUF4269 domain-containing protein [Candidatus Bathyarchaeota archaeon]